MKKTSSLRCNSDIIVDFTLLLITESCPCICPCPNAYFKVILVYYNVGFAAIESSRKQYRPWEGYPNTSPFYIASMQIQRRWLHIDWFNTWLHLDYMNRERGKGKFSMPRVNICILLTHNVTFPSSSMSNSALMPRPKHSACS